MINLTIQSTIQNTIRNTLGDVAFDMLDLFSGGQRGVWYDPSDLATMYQVDESITSLFVPVGSDKFVTSDGLNFMTKSGVPVTADGQPVGLMLDKSGNTTDASQPVATKRPTYKETPDRLEIDLVDDALLFDVPLGGIDGYMVIGTNDGTASYGVSLPAGDYDIGGDFFMGGSVNGFLLREGAVSKSDLAKVEKDFVSKGAKASYGDVTDFGSYWRDKGITEFPLIDTSRGTNFSAAWISNNLTSFPALDISNGSVFGYAWFGNNNLTDFPANMFDNCNATYFFRAFTNTNLSQSSIDGILVSIESNGTSNGTFDQSGGSAPSATGQTAIDALRSRGWTVNVTGGY